MSRVETAINNFKGGMSCSQAILYTYGPGLGLDAKAALKLGAAMSGGIGGTAKVCGAVTGGCLVLGLLHDLEAANGKQVTHNKVQQFLAEFKNRHGSVNCWELLGQACGGPKALTEAKRLGINQNVCSGLVRDVAELLESIGPVCLSVVRQATLDDVPQILDIYNQGIVDRVATMEADTKNLEYMTKWFTGRGERWKVLVAERQPGRIDGWASLNPFSSRVCYSGVADVSIYIRRDERGQGLGKMLLGELITVAKDTGFHKLVLSTFAFNEAGQRLYAATGFVKVGLYAKQGLLDGKWIDVLLMEKLL